MPLLCELLLRILSFFTRSVKHLAMQNGFHHLPPHTGIPGYLSIIRKCCLKASHDIERLWPRPSRCCECNYINFSLDIGARATRLNFFQHFWEMVGMPLVTILVREMRLKVLAKRGKWFECHLSQYWREIYNGSWRNIFDWKFLHILSLNATPQFIVTVLFYWLMA